MTRPNTMPLAEPKDHPYDILFTMTYSNLTGRVPFQFESTYPELIKVLNEVGPFELYPEFTLKGTIHYHCLLAINNKYIYYKHLLPFCRRNGYIDVQYIKYYDKTFNYVNKDVPLNEKLLNVCLPLTNGSCPISEKRWRKLIKAARYKSAEIDEESRYIESIYASIMKENERIEEYLYIEEAMVAHLAGEDKTLPSRIIHTS